MYVQRRGGSGPRVPCDAHYGRQWAGRGSGTEDIQPAATSTLGALHHMVHLNYVCTSCMYPTKSGALMSILSRSRPGADADADAGPRDKVWPPAAHRSDKLEKKPEIKEPYKKEQPTLLAAHPSSHRIVKNPRPRTFITRRTVHPPSQSMQNLTMAQLSRAVPVNSRHVRLHNSPMVPITRR